MDVPNFARMMAGSVLRIGLAVYVGLCIVLFFRQTSMVYYPVKKIAFTPADVNLAYEDVFFMTADGERIAAWYVPAANARGTILMCHGNGGNIGDRIYAIELFHNLGLNVFIFDYRGYGRSSGKPSEQGTYQDALGAWNYLTDVRHAPTESIIVQGRSLGGAVAAWLADQWTPAGLILESTFTSIPDIGAKLYPYLPVRLLSRYHYDTLGRIGRIQCPVLIAHSRDDEMIPFRHGQKLFETAPEPRTFFEQSGSHNDGEGFASDAYRRKLDEFLASTL